MSWQMIVACSFFGILVVLAFVAWEVRQTLRTLRVTITSLEPKVEALLTEHRQVAANVQGITRTVNDQAGRIDSITSNATEMLEDVKGTVELYNRTVARPAVFLASLARGFGGAWSVLKR